MIKKNLPGRMTMEVIKSYLLHRFMKQEREN